MRLINYLPLFIGLTGVLHCASGNQGSNLKQNARDSIFEVTVSRDVYAFSSPMDIEENSRGRNCFLPQGTRIQLATEPTPFLAKYQLAIIRLDLPPEFTREAKLQEQASEENAIPETCDLNTHSFLATRAYVQQIAIPLDNSDTDLDASLPSGSVQSEDPEMDVPQASEPEAEPDKVCSLGFPMRSGVYNHIDGGLFGARRSYCGNHNGLDFGAGNRTDIFAAAQGTFAQNGWHDAYGNIYAITHPECNNQFHFQTFYAHMSERLISGLKVVSHHELIGKSGNSGSASNDYHLHFEVRNLNAKDERCGRPVLRLNPQDWMRGHPG